MKKIVLILPSLLIFLISCQTKLDEGMVARVNKTNISQEEFDESLAIVKKQSEAQGQILTDADLKDVKSRLLDFMVEETILKDKALNLGLSVDDETVNKDLDVFKSQFKDGMFASWLEGSGYTEESFKEEIRTRKLIEKLIKQEVLDTLEISDEEAKTFYDENKDTYFTVPESVDCSHILVMVNEERSEADALKEIQKIKKKIDEGMDFGEAASTYSEGPSKADKGHLRSIARGQTVPPFEEAAFSQDVGVVGEPVLTQFGYHLILVNDKKPASEQSFDEVKDSIKQNLKQQKAQPEYLKYLENLKDKAKVTLVDWAREAKEEKAKAEKDADEKLKAGKAQEDKGNSEENQ